MAIAVLEHSVGVINASSVYLAAIVATAVFAGTWAAIAAATAAFLLYDYLFVQPVFTFTVANPGEWLNLVLLLFVGIVVGQLAALQRARADDARTREREARALFEVSRALATRTSTADVLPAIAGILQREAGMARAWIALGSDDARERVAADTGGEPIPNPVIYQALRRTPGNAPAVWTRVHIPGPARSRQQSGPERFRVRIDAAGSPLGSVWAIRARDRGQPHPSETRLLSAAADQIGQALAHDRFAADAQAAEIARQSDALKSALLQSVSHDLRTPLATIRAAAGTLRPGSGLSEKDQQESADAIDREVEYLNRLVTNLLDLSRIEAGALRADSDAFEIDDLVGQTLDRLRPRLAGRPVEVALDAPPIEVDAVFLDEAVTNILDNAIKYAPPTARIRVSARRAARRALCPPGHRGRGSGRARGCPAQDLRQVLSGSGRRPKLAPRNGWWAWPWCAASLRRWVAASPRVAVSSAAWLSTWIYRWRTSRWSSRGRLRDDRRRSRPNGPDRRGR